MSYLSDTLCKPFLEKNWFVVYPYKRVVPLTAVDLEGDFRTLFIFQSLSLAKISSNSLKKSTEALGRSNVSLTLRLEDKIFLPP